MTATAAAPADFDGEALYREYAPRVRSLAERRLAGRGLSDDVVQETFLRAYAARERLDPDRPVWPWLRTIANNVCTDFIRRRRLHVEQPEADVPETVSSAHTDEHEDRMLGDLRRQVIEEALGALHPRQRRVLMLNDVEGMAVVEVAAADGLTVDAVRSILKRGRRSFRAQYQRLAATHGVLGAIPALVAASVSRAWTRLRETLTKVAGIPPEFSLPVRVVAVGIGISATVAATVMFTLEDGDAGGPPPHHHGAADAVATRAGDPARPLRSPRAAEAAIVADGRDGREVRPAPLVGAAIDAGPGVGAGVDASAGIVTEGERETLNGKIEGRLPVLGEVWSRSGANVDCGASTLRRHACDTVDRSP